MFNIVLVNPEIPHNTGAAGRLALATGAALHLVKPLGFSVDDKQVKRAGLDYWKDVKIVEWESLEHFLAGRDSSKAVYCLTTKTKTAYWDSEFQEGDYLLFGRETKGLPESLLSQHSCLTIPMEDESTRSLNLATSVGIVLFEGMRQLKMRQNM